MRELVNQLPLFDEGKGGTMAIYDSNVTSVEQGMLDTDKGILFFPIV